MTNTKKIKKSFLTSLVITTLILGSVIGISTITTDNAYAQANLNKKVLPPSAHVYDEFTDKWWQWLTSIPTEQNPANPDTTDCTANQSGNVWFLNGVGALEDSGGFIERDCAIPTGKQILFPIINLIGSETTSENAESFNEILTQLLDTATDLQVTVDGIPLQNLEQYRFKESQAFMIDCQAINLVCLEGEDYAVHEGYFVMLTPLTPGQHIIEFSGTIDFFGTPFTTGATYNITVG